MNRSQRRSTSNRSAFTLIELMVVVSILLVLLTFTATAVNYAFNGEKVNGAARQVQSYLAGARDRAIHAGEPRGVRFLRDDDNPAAVTALLFIGPSETWNEGHIRLEREDGDGDGAADSSAATIVAASPDSGWWELAKRKTFYGTGLRIRIPNDRSGSWYTIIGRANPAVWNADDPPIFNPNDGDATTNDPYPLKIRISPAYRDPATNPANEVQAFAGGGPSTYSLELSNVILPERSVDFPKGTVIDLLSSDVPASWKATTRLSTDIPAFNDIMFSPRGTVTGDAASKGVIHFYVTELNSMDLFRQYVGFTGANYPPGGYVVPADELPGMAPDGVSAEPVGDRSLVSVFTQTGRIAAHQIDVTDTQDPEDIDGDMDFNEVNGIADDPFFFAETGAEQDQ